MRAKLTSLAARNVLTRQTAKCFEILCGSLFDHVLRQMRCGWALVPFERLQIIAHKLFIEAGRALPENVLVLWPEARRIRCQTFVDQKQIFIDSAELKFRV